MSTQLFFETVFLIVIYMVIIGHIELKCVCAKGEPGRQVQCYYTNFVKSLKVFFK